MLSRDRFNIVRTTFCVHRFFYSFTASDGSEGTTAGCVVALSLVDHGFRSKEVCKKTKFLLHQTSSHSSLLVACQSDVSRKLNQAFLLVDPFYSNFFEECSNIIIMVIFKCYFSGEHIALSIKKEQQQRCEHRIRKKQQIKSTVHDAN